MHELAADERPDESKPDESKPDESKPNEESPKTGDSNHTLPLIGLLLLSGSALIGVTRNKKKKKITTNKQIFYHRTDGDEIFVTVCLSASTGDETIAVGRFGGGICIIGVFYVR